MIEVRNLTRRFGPVTAVYDVSFRVASGEVVGFLGPNGAGKTTTMRILTGFLPVTSGAVSIAGHDVLRDSLAARRCIGYLPEAVPLYREHRVEEMLVFQGRLHGLSRREARQRTGQVLERVGMAERRRSVIARLSKGQRQRIGLAVALLPDPRVLILDEPTSGLDPLQRIEVRRLVGELARDRTVLVSSHILPEIEAVAQRILILHRGRVVADGRQTELLEQLGESFVRVRVAAVEETALADALRELPGVERVEPAGGGEGVAAARVFGQGDLRPRIGQLCLSRGWVLHELLFERPTLERIFARIALDIEEPEAVEVDGDTA